MHWVYKRIDSIITRTLKILLKIINYIHCFNTKGYIIQITVKPLIQLTTYTSFIIYQLNKVSSKDLRKF